MPAESTQLLYTEVNVTYNGIQVLLSVCKKNACEPIKIMWISATLYKTNINP